MNNKRNSNKSAITNDFLEIYLICFSLLTNILF